MKILCVGELLVDMIASETSIQSSKEFHARPGGAPANVAVAASRTGADVDMAATVGDDGFGDKLIEKMEEEEVGVENINVSDKKTTLAFVALNDSAEPEFSFYRGADLEISENQLGHGYDIVHFGSLPFTDEKLSKMLLTYARESEALISFDPNLRSELADEDYMNRVKRFIELSDLVFLSEEEKKNFEIEAQEVIVTKGSKGAELITNEFTKDKNPPEIDVLDTTGAGDALTGTYLAFRHLSKEKALEKAVLASALSTQEKGAMSAIPTESDIDSGIQ